jgi:hypothetical protein
MTSTSAPPAPAPVRRGAVADDPDSRSYVRSVGLAWLISMPVTALVVTILVLTVSDLSVWGSIGIGLFAGVWTAPLGAVAGVGVWSAKHQH